MLFDTASGNICVVPGVGYCGCGWNKPFNGFTGVRSLSPSFHFDSVGVEDAEDAPPPEAEGVLEAGESELDGGGVLGKSGVMILVLPEPESEELPLELDNEEDPELESSARAAD
jgi:hypothetical protein